MHPYHEKAKDSRGAALKRAGAEAGDAVQDKRQTDKEVRSAMTQHEDNLHDGKHTPIRLAKGGSVTLSAGAGGGLGRLEKAHIAKDI